MNLYSKDSRDTWYDGCSISEMTRIRLNYVCRPLVKLRKNIVINQGYL